MRYQLPYVEKGPKRCFVKVKDNRSQQSRTNYDSNNDSNWISKIMEVWCYCIRDLRHYCLFNCLSFRYSNAILANEQAGIPKSNPHCICWDSTWWNVVWLLKCNFEVNAIFCEICDLVVESWCWDVGVRCVSYRQLNCWVDFKILEAIWSQISFVIGLCHPTKCNFLFN